MFPHLSFPASVVHHYHHYLTPLSLHRARLAKSQVSIKQSTYFCLHSCGWTFAEGKKHRARRWPLSSWNHELESHVGAQHLFSFHIAFLAFPLSQITISELFPPQSLHLFFPTLRCQLVTSLHTALKRKKICQRGTLNFPHSKMYDATCVYSYNLCLPFSYSGWNVFTPVKVSPPLVRWFPSHIDFAVFSFRISDSSLSPESFPSTHKPFVMSFIISFWCPPENYTFCWQLLNLNFYPLSLWGCLKLSRASQSFSHYFWNCQSPWEKQSNDSLGVLPHWNLQSLKTTFLELCYLQTDALNFEEIQFF